MNGQTGFVHKPYLKLNSTGWLNAISQGQQFLQANTGTIVAATILLLWGGSLVALAPIALSDLGGWLLPAILVRTFLHTGLFIVAHDAMHGTVCSHNRKLNHAIGRFAISLYAFLRYDRSLEKHWSHHRQPGREGDPDFHGKTHRHPIAWYLTFMSRYLDRSQNLILMVGMGSLFFALHLVLNAPFINLMLLWVLPIVLSSVQLFYFGTYLPHRQPEQGYDNPHHAQSLSCSALWSFVTCYHFGYHWEHHEYPQLPWYALPSVRDR
ncbi:fatty acid desaturase [Oculatella sp. LEGE 06141]|uniref:fatty acid desaturase n=1 Tax=Oculatella sp. LEGE 06141 TaxID=1828648 RepID=UPI0018811E41|nr:fatty acid desaturase [Oculatella sp. LEGE 06141]MBE9177547.1 fatty acid desaturase [Oculatella sp. LEGE 06141]